MQLCVSLNKKSHAIYSAEFFLQSIEFKAGNFVLVSEAMHVVSFYSLVLMEKEN